MLNKLFWKDALERSVRTVAQTLVSLWTVGELFNLFTVDWGDAAGVSLGAGMLSLLMSVAASQTGKSQSASLVVETKGEIK